MFVFFSKQKTAYEMRISDWSSDVCSSDLAGAERRGQADVGQVGHQHVLRARRLQRADDGHLRGDRATDDRLRLLRVGHHREHIDGYAPHAVQRVRVGPAAVQIERASWRERVGHAVYISVGAGYVKKKKNKQD